MRFRYRPTVVEAIQWFPGVQIAGVIERAGGVYAYIPNAHGVHIADPGDWIVIEPDGRINRYHPFEFDRRFQPEDEITAPPPPARAGQGAISPPRELPNPESHTFTER